MAKAQKYLVPLLLLTLCAAAFSSIAHAGFVRMDDDIQVYQNPGLNPPSFMHLTQFWQRPYDQLYIPLSYSVFSLVAALAHLQTPVRLSDAIVTDLNPRIFHLESLGLHLGCTLLVYALLRRFVRYEWAAGAGALLFGLHPLQVESVAWVSEMRGLIASLFSLLAIILYLRFVETGRRLLWSAATMCFLLALLSKPAAATVPLLCGALEIGLFRRSWRELVLPLFPWIIISSGFILLTRAVQPIPPDVLTPFWTRPLVALDALAFYLGKLVWPAHLGLDYGRTPSFVISHGWAFGTALIPLGLGMVVWRVGSRKLLTAAAIFVLALLPTLGLIPFIFQTYSTVADRYAYLSLLGPALALAWGLEALERRLPSRQLRVVGTACAAALLLLGLRTSVQATRWQDSMTIFTATLETNPQSWFIRNNLGNTLADLGDVDGAISEFRAVSRLRPEEARPHFNLAAALLRRGDLTGAEAEYRLVVRLRPTYAPAYNNLGCVLSRRGQWAEARSQFEASLRLDPAFADAHRNLAIAQAH